MKLFELINPIVKTSKMSVPFDTNNMRLKASGNPSGLLSYAKEHPRDPHLISLRSKAPLKPPADRPYANTKEQLKSDSKYQWLKYAANNAHENPFLPRVYEIDVKVDSKGKVMPRYKIEKLQHINQLNQESLEYLFTSLFPNSELPEDASSGEIIMAIDNILNDMVTQKNTKVTNNTHLKRAIKAVYDLIDEYPEFVVDLHDKNFMVRNTPVGPQLVFTDPLF